MTVQPGRFGELNPRERKGTRQVTVLFIGARGALYSGGRLFPDEQPNRKLPLAADRDLAARAGEQHRDLRVAIGDRLLPAFQAIGDLVGQSQPHDGFRLIAIDAQAANAI